MFLRRSKMRSMAFLILMISALNAYADNSTAEVTKGRISHFRSITIHGDYIIVEGDQSNISVIPKDGPYEVKKWEKRPTVRIGDTIETRGGQLDLYWKLLEIKEDRVKFHHYGFQRGLGDVDEVFWIKAY